MTAITREMILGPELARDTAGMDRQEYGKLYDDLCDEAARIKQLMEAVDNGEMYLPGFEPSVRYPGGEWRRN